MLDSSTRHLEAVLDGLDGLLQIALWCRGDCTRVRRRRAAEARKLGTVVDDRWDFECDGHVDSLVGLA